MRGRVLRGSGLMQLVQVEEELWQCELRGRLKEGVRRTNSPVFAGDWVEVTQTSAGVGVIEAVHPRLSRFSRCASGSRPYEQVFAVNLDQLVVVVAMREPELRIGFLDRAIVMALKGQMAPLICINKVDLAAVAEHESLRETYAALGYTVVCTSAATGVGVDKLETVLAGKTSGMVGQSGVGKSSLLNRIDPDLALRTQELMAQHDRGRHTTTATELYELQAGGYIADTPGIKELRLWGVDHGSLAEYFVEMQPLLGRCRYRDCSHLHEPDCAVQDAARRGHIAPLRYAGYQRIMASL
jgi:ribosome biogenesis GTPase / thiamine phosphate phosphatase